MQVKIITDIHINSQNQEKYIESPQDISLCYRSANCKTAISI